MVGDPLVGDELHQDIIPAGLERDDADIRGVTLVARSRVRDVDQTNFHCTISTLVLTTVLSINAGQYATISSTFGRPPANPVTLGGPFSTSGAISRVNRSTAALSCPRTPMRSWTSGTSPASPTSGPCVEENPTNSVSTWSNFKPRLSSRSRRTL